MKKKIIDYLIDYACPIIIDYEIFPIAHHYSVVSYDVKAQWNP